MKAHYTAFARIIFAVFLATAAMYRLGAAEVSVSGVDGSRYAAYRLLVSDGDNFVINDKYAASLYAAAGDTAVNDYLLSLDEIEVRGFADRLYTGIIGDPYLEADAISEDGRFSDLAPGYYLISEVKTGTRQDSVSLVMLNVVGDEPLSVFTKEDIPALTKQVAESDDSSPSAPVWQDAADYDIGDAVGFRLIGTLPTDLDRYDSYCFIFHDSISPDMTLLVESVTVSIDDAVLAPEYYSISTVDELVVSFPDISEAGADGGSTVTVEYSALLDDSAVCGGEGNQSAAWLEYSINPYGGGIGRSIADKVTVFTHSLELSGFDAADDVYSLFKYYAADGGYTEVADSISDGVISGIDSGRYMLVSDSGDRIEFEVWAEYEAESDDPKLSALTVETISADRRSDISVSIGERDNESGEIYLPSAGGPGAVIFYIGGGILMLAALVPLCDSALKKK